MAPNRRSVSMADFAAGITDIGDMAPSINILIYGDPGSGKTCLAAGLPNALFLACDPSWIAAVKIGRRPPNLRVISNFETLDAGLSWLEDGNASNYRWIVVDGLSVLQMKLLHQFSREAWEDNPAKRVSAHQPDKPDYFRQQNVIKTSVARLMDLPTNVLVTAHAVDGDDNGEPVVRPHIEGRGYAVGNAVTALPAMIGYLYPSIVGEGKEARQVRRIRWEQVVHPETGVTYMAKNQINEWTVTDDLSPEALDAVAGTPVGSTQNGRRRTRATGKPQ